MDQQMCPYGSYSARLVCDCVFCQRDRLREENINLKGALADAVADVIRLNFLQALTDRKKYTGKVILRDSTTGRGWRLHEHGDGYLSVREAIDAYMKENPA